MTNILLKGFEVKDEVSAYDTAVLEADAKASRYREECLVVRGAIPDDPDDPGYCVVSALVWKYMDKPKYEIKYRVKPNGVTT